MAVGGVQLELLGAQLHAARHREALHLTERERRRALHVPLPVVVAQRALGRARLPVEALHARLAEAEGQSREREPTQQMVEVRVRGDQRIGLEARARQQARQRLELVGEVGRVDSMASSPARSATALVCHIRLVMTSASG